MTQYAAKGGMRTYSAACFFSKTKLVVYCLGIDEPWRVVIRRTELLGLVDPPTKTKKEITARAISLLLVDHLGLEPRTDRLYSL